MLRPPRPRCLVAIGCVIVASCAGDDARSHVFQSAPPVRATQPTTTAPVRPEPPIGTTGPSAKITSVRLASTGEIASLDDIRGSLDVVTVASRGPGSSSAGPARLELRLTGPTDTTLTEVIDAPVPIVVAHVFRVEVARGVPSLRDGVHRGELRLVGPAGGVVARSIPLTLTVRGR